MTVQPIDLNAVLGILIGGAIAIIPLLAIFARVALKPVVEALAGLRAASAPGNVAVLERRLALMERRLAELDGKQLQLPSAEALQRISNS